MPGVEKDLPVIEGIFEASALKPGLQPIAEADRIGILGGEEDLHLGARPALLAAIAPEAKLDRPTDESKPYRFLIGAALLARKDLPESTNTSIVASVKIKIRNGKNFLFWQKSGVLHAKRGRLPCPLTARDRD